MRNAIEILKLISQGKDDIKQGDVESQENVFNDIEKIKGLGVDLFFRTGNFKIAKELYNQG